MKIKVFGVVILVFVSLYILSRYRNPALYGEWTSVTTSQTIRFNQNNTVELEDSFYKPYFEIVSPSKMLYIVDEKIFDMYFELDGRILYWGIDKNNLEKFER